MIDGIRFRIENNLIVLQVHVVDPNNPWRDANGNWLDARVEDMLEVAAFAKGDTSRRVDMLELNLDILRREFHNVENGSLPP